MNGLKYHEDTGHSSHGHSIENVKLDTHKGVLTRERLNSYPGLLNENRTESLQVFENNIGNSNKLNLMNLGGSPSTQK
jgi:hypothetical protein